MDDITQLKAALATIDSVPMSSIPKNMMQMVLEKKCGMYKEVLDKLMQMIDRDIAEKNDQEKQDGL